MNDFIEAIKDFFYEKKLIAIIAAILIFFALCALIIVSIQTTPEKKVTIYSLPENFSSDSELLAPSGPKVLEEYYPSRVTKEKWEAKDAEEFFTVPDSESLKKLEKANDKVVLDILEAAP